MEEISALMRRGQWATNSFYQVSVKLETRLVLLEQGPLQPLILMTPYLSPLFSRTPRTKYLPVYGTLIPAETKADRESRLFEPY